MKRTQYPIYPDFKKWSRMNPPLNRAMLPILQRLLGTLFDTERKSRDLNVAKEYILSSDGSRIRALLYSPIGLAANAPCLLYFHGGGFVMPAAPYHYSLAREYALRARCKVLFVDYRLAPKHPFPAAPEDCYGAYCHVISHAAELSIDPCRIAVSGDSAGAELAVDVCLMAKEYGQTIHMMDKLGVDVRLGVEATPEMIEAEHYDVVMTALGASNIILPIPGHDDPRCICAVDAFGNADKIGQKVVLIGGGEVGCEAALYLAMECGKDVSVIEMMDRIASTSAYAQELALYDRVPKFCHLYLESPVTRITPTQVGYKDKEGVEHFLDADTVIFSSGRKPLDAEAEKFRKCAPKFFKLGDCLKASNVRNANRTAYDAAAQI